MKKIVGILVLFFIVAGFVSAVSVSESDLDMDAIASMPDGSDGKADDFLPVRMGISMASEKAVGLNGCSPTSASACTCSDTDGGINFLVQGTVSGAFGSIPYSFTDFCMNTVPGHEGSNKLVEWYCKEGICGFKYPWFTKVECEFGCEDGRCNDNEIPEFGVIGAGVAVLGAVAGVLLFRKHK